MDLTIYKIYEIQNKGKGAITSLTPADLLSLTADSNMPSLEEVLIENPNLTDRYITRMNSTAGWEIRGQEEGSGYIYVDGNENENVYPISAIGIRDDSGNNEAEIRNALEFYQEDILLRDLALSRGIVYAGDYESNFVARSLVTKQYVDSKTTGSETKVTAGTNVTISGNGTTATPYVINSAGASTLINAGTNISVTGNGSVGTPFIISNTQVVDGSETKINNSSTITKTGTGTIADPFVLSTVVNSNQKVITYPADFTGTNYTLLASDHDKLIIVKNGATNVTITVPTGLAAEHFTAFIRQGTGEVSFTASGTTISSYDGLRINGTFQQVALDRELSTTTFYLTGNTKV